MVGRLNDKVLIKEIEKQRDLMVSVSTGGLESKYLRNVNTNYVEKKQLIGEELNYRRIEDPNPYSNLYEWHGKWTSGDLPTYQSRRDFIAEIYNPLINFISTGYSKDISEETTGWTKVDKDLSIMRDQLAEASTEMQFQGVGHACREILISLAQYVYDSSLHFPENGKTPSKTDAIPMLEGYISKELSGPSNEELRGCAKASLALANALQHKRTATFRDAAICACATSSVVNLIAIISGKRDPK